MAKKSITKRWIFNNLGVVVLVLLVFDMAFIYAIHKYYYSSAKQYLISKLNAVTSVLSIHAQDTSANFSAEMRNMLESFQKSSGALICKDLKGRDTGRVICECDDCVRNAVYALGEAFPDRV